jgi:5-methylcytosine-specific restriction endonuclease McrA
MKTSTEHTAPSKALPLTIDRFLIRADRGVTLNVSKVDLSSHPGMSRSTEGVLLSHTCCCRCGERPKQLGNHALCSNEDQKWRGWEIALSVPSASADAINVAFRKEIARLRQFERKRRLVAAGGTHTRSETRALFALQEGRCYYCFMLLKTPEGTVECHRDHFEPLFYGGSNAISNIVLSCARCNTRKGTLDGASFARTSMSSAVPEVKVGLRRIHDACSRFKQISSAGSAHSVTSTASDASTRPDIPLRS